MSDHAVLSPSSAHRWIACPGSIRLSAKAPPRAVSSPAAEGTLAHDYAHAAACARFGCDHEPAEGGDDDMIRHAEAWADFLAGLGSTAYLEHRVSMPGIESFGTADAVVFDGDEVHLADYKYGVGVLVRAERNPQLMMYAAAATQGYSDDTVVHLHIFQPRRSHVDSWSTTAGDLSRWMTDTVAPAAAEAMSDDARVVPGEVQCRWCPAAAICRPRAEQALRQDFGDPDVLSNREVAEILDRLPEVEMWVRQVREHAESLAVHNLLPGWKVVRGRGRRSIVDEDEAIRRLSRAGVDASLLFTRRLVALGVLERAARDAGVSLEEVLGEVMQRSDGRPVLAAEDDPRPSVVESDFA